MYKRRGHDKQETTGRRFAKNDRWIKNFLRLLRNRVASLILSPVRFQHHVNDPLPPSFLLPPSLILSSSLLPRTRIPSKNKRVPMWRGFCNQRPVGGAKRGNSSRCFYKAVARLGSVSPGRSRKRGKKRVGDGTRLQTARKSPRGHRIPTLLKLIDAPQGTNDRDTRATSLFSIETADKIFFANEEFVGYEFCFRRLFRKR